MFKRINFQSIPATDQQRALEFYRDVLGFSVHTDERQGKTDYRWIFMAIPGAGTLLHFHGVDSVPASEKPVLCLLTDDTDAVAARLAEAGVSMVAEPSDAPWNPIVRWSTFRDSEGNLIMMQSTPMEV